MTVFGLDHETLEYGYRMDGPFDPQAGHRFDPNVVLLGPVRQGDRRPRRVGRRRRTGIEPYQHRARVLQDDFDWAGRSRRWRSRPKTS